MKSFHEHMVFGIATAFFSACCGLDDAGQFIMFAFGISWGHMILRTETPR